MNLSKISLSRALLIVTLAGFAFSLVLIFNFVPKSSIQSGPAPLVEGAVFFPKQEQAGFGLPVRLKIPKINVDAAVESVGLTSDGAMDVPKDITNTAWFDQGPRPGEQGSAVIDGHFGWKNGIPAVFDNLHKLQKGDKLYIEDDKGVIVSFVVREFRTYDPNADASDVFGSNDGKAHLNLITCEGVWNKTEESYPGRLVVFADKVIE